MTKKFRSGTILSRKMYERRTSKSFEGPGDGPSIYDNLNNYGT